MLDPFTTLGLVSNIAQLVGFAKDVISDGRDIAKLGSTSSNEHIRTVVKDMEVLSKTISEEYRPDLKEQGKDEDALHELGQASSSHKKTYEWVFDSATTGFKDWARIKNGIFWVTGKPGSGKSTLMKYLSKHKRTCDLLQSWAGSDKLVIASHYFWIAGNATQRSQSGLLRSLLFQIMQQCPDIVPLVAPQRILDQDSVKHAWTMSELTETMQRIGDLQSLPIQICIFIDGLDEYDGEHSELVQLLSDLEKSPKIKMAVSSRPWNVFDNAYELLPSRNKIIMQKLTRKDIETYVKDHLLANDHFQKLTGRPSARADLIKEITGKSNGVFLWVFLVVRSLLRGLTNCDDLDILEQRVAEFPDSLNEYFQRMLDSTEKVYSVQTARILLASIHSDGSLPLRLVDDLYTETKDADYDIWLSVTHSEPTLDQRKREVARVKKLLNARCRDLLEVVREEIDFLHRTVKDFLTTRDVYSTLLERAGPGFEPISSLSKVTVTLMKSNPRLGPEIFNHLLGYESLNAFTACPSDIGFIRKIAASRAAVLEGSDRATSSDQHAKSEKIRRTPADSLMIRSRCDCHRNGKVKRRRRAKVASRLLNVEDSQDWLISVKSDLSTTIGAKGDFFVDLDSRFLCCSVVGYCRKDEGDVYDGNVFLFREHGDKLLVEDIEDNDNVALVARFCDGGRGLYERQRAFIRMAQVVFVERNAQALRQGESKAQDPVAIQQAARPAASLLHFHTREDSHREQ